MNSLFDDAITTHLDWVSRFDRSLAGDDRGTLVPGEIGNDRHCDFGRWLHANSTLFPDAQRFDYVRTLHMVFHEIAAEVAALMRQPAARTEVEAKLGALKDLSTQLVVVLRELAIAHAQDAIAVAHPTPDRPRP